MKYEVIFYNKETGINRGTRRVFGESSIFDLAAACFNAGRSGLFDSMDIKKTATDENGEEFIIKRYKWERDRSLGSYFMESGSKIKEECFDTMFPECDHCIHNNPRCMPKDKECEKCIKYEVGCLPSGYQQKEEKPKPKYMTEEAYQEFLKEMEEYK